MEKQTKLPVIAVFNTIVAYTFLGIFQLGRQGGPCNAGIALIVLVPSLLVCVALLAISLFRLMKKRSPEVDKSILLTVLSAIIWTFWLHTFYEDSPQESLLYLGPFEGLIILLFIFFVWKSTKKTSVYLTGKEDNSHSM